MNKMLTHLNGYKREAVLAPLFKMLEATFDLFVPLVMADIVNVGIAAHDFHYILVRCGILLLLAVVGLACSLTAQYFSAKAAVGYSTSLRHAMYLGKFHIISGCNGKSSENTAGKQSSLTAYTYDHNILSSHYLSPSLTNLIASNLHRLLQSPHPVHMVSSIWIVLSAFLVIAGQPGFIHIPHFLHLSGSSA